MNYLNYQFTYELPVYTCTTIATLCLLSQAHAVNRKGNSLASRFTGIENPERMRDTELLSWSTARHKIVLFHCYSFEPLIVFIVSYQGVVPKWSCPVTRRYRVYSLPQLLTFLGKTMRTFYIPARLILVEFYSQLCVWHQRKPGWPYMGNTAGVEQSYCCVGSCLMTLESEFCFVCFDVVAFKHTKIMYDPQRYRQTFEGTPYATLPYLQLTSGLLEPGINCAVL